MNPASAVYVVAKSTVFGAQTAAGFVGLNVKGAMLDTVTSYVSDLPQASVTVTVIVFSTATFAIAVP